MSNIGNITIENDDPDYAFMDCLPERECVEQWISIGLLARQTGLSCSKIRKWTKEGLIPHCKRPGEHYMYPDRQAVQAVRAILKAGGGRKQCTGPAYCEQ